MGLEIHLYLYFYLIIDSNYDSIQQNEDLFSKSTTPNNLCSPRELSKI